MKKLFIVVIMFLPLNIYALNKDKVDFFRCVDGDTAKFILNKQEITVRFLGIDTPESVKPNEEVEEYGKEASNYTCRKLKHAKKIVLEYDEKADSEDKYDRVLAYVFLDDKLLQEDILKNGYAKVKYINKEYKYYDRLVDAENKAKEKKKGIYSDKTDEINEDNYKEKIVKFIKKYAKKIFSNILREIFK